jgi:C4-dicarboxylate transporter DctM subunit
MTDPVMLTVWGLLATFVLVFLHVPVGVAMGLAGVTGFGLMAGFDPAFAMIASETSNALSSLDLVTIPLFVLMGSFASLAGLSRTHHYTSNCAFSRIRPVCFHNIHHHA